MEATGQQAREMTAAINHDRVLRLRVVLHHEYLRLISLGQCKYTTHCTSVGSAQLQTQAAESQ